MTGHGSQISFDEFAAGRLDAADVEVLRQLASLYTAVDPVPAGLVDRIQFGLTLDALRAELAELQWSGDLAGVRSGQATEAQTVTFTSASLTTMVTITSASADRVRIDGWAAPGAGLIVELRLQGQTVSTTADGDGRFVFDDVPRGLAQFVLRPPPPGDRPPVVTPSIEL